MDIERALEDFESSREWDYPRSQQLKAAIVAYVRGLEAQVKPVTGQARLELAPDD